MEIPSYIKEIRAVHFSLAGQASAAAFSERIVRAVDAKMLKYKATIHNRAAYFFKLCHELCRERNVQPNKMTAAALHEELGTNDRLPMVLSAGKNPEPLMTIPEGVTADCSALKEKIANPFTEYYKTLTDEQKAVYDNDEPFQGYRHCTPEELAARQKQFVSIPVPDAALKFLPMGYAERVYKNLRFIPLGE